MDVDSEGVEAKQEDIDSEIVLEAFNEVGRGKVFLDYPATVFTAIVDYLLAVS